ncbi:hypothetical protein ZWY2020_040844 [Hordeum vulgare]|nr:hypothetical protein ZWY2020_040844 [Hordeum vulgare]
MFNNKDYEIDENSREYEALHPQVATKEPHLIEEHFESVSEDEDEQDAGSSDASAESDSDTGMHNSKRIRLYEVKDGRHAEAFLNSVSLGNQEAVPIGDRVAALERKQNSRVLDKVKYGPGGSREISFNPRSSRRCTEEDEHSEEEQKDYKRRSVQSLGLKQNKAEFYLFGGRGGRGGGGGGRSRGGGGGDRGRRGGGGRGRGGGGRGGGGGDFGGGGFGGGSEFGGRGGGRGRGRGRGMSRGRGGGRSRGRGRD